MRQAAALTPLKTVAGRQAIELVTFVCARAFFHDCRVVGDQRFLGGVPAGGHAGQWSVSIGVGGQYGRFRPVTPVDRGGVENALAVIVLVRDAVGPHQKQLVLPDREVGMVAKFVGLGTRLVNDLVLARQSLQAERLRLCCIE